MRLKDIINVAKNEKSKKQKANETKKLAAGITIGAILGTAAGIFVAPKSGKETLLDLKEKSEKALEAVNEKVKTIKDTANKTSGDIKEEMSEKIEDLEDIIPRGKV